MQKGIAFYPWYLTDLKHSENHKHRFNGRGKPLPYKLNIHKNPPSSQPSQNRTIPCFAPSHLPPLLKGGGLTARHKPWYYCFLLAICQPFLCCKLFAVKTEGLHNNPSPRITLPKTALFLRLAPHSWLPWVKGAGLRQGYFYHKLSCSAIQVYLISSQPYLSQDWGIVTPPAPPFPKPHYPFALHHHTCLLINVLFVSHTHYHHRFL